MFLSPLSFSIGLRTWISLQADERWKSLDRFSLWKFTAFRTKSVDPIQSIDAFSETRSFNSTIVSNQVKESKDLFGISLRYWRDHDGTLVTRLTLPPAAKSIQLLLQNVETWSLWRIVFVTKFRDLTNNWLNQILDSTEISCLRCKDTNTANNSEVFLELYSSADRVRS